MVCVRCFTRERCVLCFLTCLQNSTAEKLRREVVRLTTEAERLEKEVQRQKNLR